ncbi:MAG: alpha/beta fold hydrolase, partial [Chitinophagaceae bacterium]|nr:alpha/beta fold hydrolase [Oligoflexus sp.]
VHVQGWAGIHSEFPPVILVHDLGENSDFYAPAARILADRGFQAYCYDMRGHGRSSPLDNKSLGFNDLIQDLLQVVAWIRYKSGRRKPFLIAQGMGALVVLHFQKLYPQYCTRSILLAPTFEEQTALPFFSRVFLKTMAQVLPWATLPTTLLPYFLPMSDEASQKASSLHLNARFAYDLREAVRNAATTFLDVSSPNLIGSPIEDELYNRDHLRKLVMEHPFNDMLSYREIPGIGANALCGDLAEVQNALAVIIPWMLEICPVSTSSLL